MPHLYSRFTFGRTIGITIAWLGWLTRLTAGAANANLFLIFSVAGSFQWNLFISAMARLICYGSVAIALPVLRRKDGAPEARFRLPMGWLFAVLAAATSLLLLFPRLDRKSLVVLGILASA